MSVHLRKGPWVLLAVFTYGCCEILRDVSQAPLWLTVTSKVLAGGIAATGLLKTRSEPPAAK